jgi:hypothetical protein
LWATRWAWQNHKTRKSIKNKCKTVWLSRIVRIIFYLASQETFVIEEAVRERNASRVTNTCCAKISNSSGAKTRVWSESVEEEIVQESWEKRWRAELVP